MDDIKKLLQEKIREAYMEGAHRGSITTCAVLYETMKTAGLEEKNLLFDLLKDIAKKHGCEDLPAVVESITSKTDT